MLRSKRLPRLVMGLTLLILGGAIALTTWQVRGGIRRQMAQRDAEVLHAVVLMEYENDLAQGIAGPISDVGSQLGVVLKSSQLAGVLGIRLFDASGRFVGAFPPYVLEGGLDRGDLPELQRLQPVSRFRGEMRSDALFHPEKGDRQTGERTLPMLEVNVPLHSRQVRQLAGVAQFLIEGQSIAAEYIRLDRQLALQALLVFVAGGGMLVLAIGWAFHRLRQTQLLLAERSENLLRANQELALAVKTTALGSVTAHLIHGLKNPLAGLQSYMTARGSGPGDEEAADWQQAVTSTRRMQAMIGQVVSVLREEQTGTNYEISISELIGMIRQRVAAAADETQVRLMTESDVDDELPNRPAQLVALILVNLVQNALQATPAGGTVTLAITSADEQLRFEVKDEGPGFPEDLTPFAPCRTTKEGGCGIGLALSQQLAHHLGAELALKNCHPHGCVFVLTLPVTQHPETAEETSVSVIR